MNQNNSTIVLSLRDVTGQDNGIIYKFQGPIDLTGATMTFVIEFDATAAAWATTNAGSNDEKVVFQAWDSTGAAQWWLCDKAGIIASQDTTYSCGSMTVKAADSQATANVKLLIGPKAGTATIKSATIQLAQ